MTTTHGTAAPLPIDTDLQCVLTALRLLATIPEPHGKNPAATARRRAAKKKARNSRRRNRK